MEKVRCVGLDVHEQSITIAVAEPEAGDVTLLRTIPHDVNELLKTLKGLIHTGVKLKVAYEAGACGAGLWRRLNDAEIECVMIAPSRLPKDGRQKTDKEDARRIARYLRSGDLTDVYVPDEETEALRALTRAREDAIQAQQRARGQLRNFLVHQGRKFEDVSKWTKAHMDWIQAQQFAHRALELVRDDYVREVTAAAQRIERLTKDIKDLAPQSRQWTTVQSLMALRGVELITAATLVFEIGHFTRFAKAQQLMSYLGLVPREASSGERITKGSITKAGNSHIRRVLCEAAWNYRYGQTSKTIAKRRAATSPGVQAIAEKAQVRLHDRYERLMNRRKEANKINVAISRELAGFIWAIGVEVETKPKKEAKAEA
jgi:transposase